MRTPGIGGNIDRPPTGEIVPGERYRCRVIVTATPETRQQPSAVARHPFSGAFTLADPDRSRLGEVAGSPSASPRSILTSTRSTTRPTERMSALSDSRRESPFAGRRWRPIVIDNRTTPSRSSDVTARRWRVNSERAQNIWRNRHECYAVSHRVSVTTLTSDTQFPAGAPASRSPRTRPHLTLCPPVRAARTEISVRDEPRSATRVERIDGASVGTEVVRLVRLRRRGWVRTNLTGLCVTA